MASPADPSYMSRRQLEVALELASYELTGMSELFAAVVAKVGSVELTRADLKSAVDLEIQRETVTGGYRISIKKDQG